MRREEITRRDFLGTIAVGAAGLGFAPNVLGAAEEAPQGKRRLKLGFLGASHSHAPGKLQVALKASDYEFVGVCEESKSIQEKVRQQGAPVISLAELLDRAEVIAVESAVEQHAADALKVLEAGKHVHVEKPPATKPGELERLLEKAREKRVVLQTGYMWRYNPGFTKIFEAVRKGWLGDVFSVRASLSNYLAPERRPDWGAFQGGSLFDLGSHVVDAVVRLLGEPKSIHSYLRHDGLPADNLKDNNLVVMEFGRAVAGISNNALQKSKIGQRTFEVIGSNGAAMLQPFEPPELEIELVEAAGPYQRGAQKVPLPPYERYEADLQALAAAVRGEKELEFTPEVELQVQNALLRACGVR